MSDNQISKSKQKRMAIENERKKIKAQKNLRSFITVLVIALIVASCAGIYLYIKAKSAPFDYSKYLAEDGTIKGINIDEYINMPIESLSVSADVITPDEDYINNTINADLNANATLDTEKVSVSGDRVNIYYEAYIGDTLYNASTADNQGSDFIIGLASISEDFDNALIGHKAGDEFTVDVTFPVSEDSNILVAGETATYNIHFNGTYSIPELTDEYIATYHADEATTVDEYRQLIIDSYRQRTLPQAITDSILANAVVAKYPEKYLNHIKEMLDQQNKLTLSMYASQYSSLTLYQLVGCQNEAEYQALLTENATSNVTCTLAYQSFAKQLGMTNTREEVNNYLLTNGSTQEDIDRLVETYGYNYVASTVLQNRVIDYLNDNITITE